MLHSAPLTYAFKGSLYQALFVEVSLLAVPDGWQLSNMLSSHWASNTSEVKDSNLGNLFLSFVLDPPVQHCELIVFSIDLLTFTVFLRATNEPARGQKEHTLFQIIQHHVIP